jgi:cytochrome c peroxidase
MRKPLFTSILIFSISWILFSAGVVNLNNLFNYANQSLPSYIVKDNTPANNTLDNKIATLGRVLFYDKNLSLHNNIACASCHNQQFAFGDTAVLSTGFEGQLTGRHSMRLVNARFGTETNFFWDERAMSLEEQTTMPIQDHIEMGFSGTNGQPNFDSLVSKLSSLTYYPTLFYFAFGSNQITESRIQRALSQFVRSIQSFDSKFDLGRAQVPNDGVNFPNFTAQENQGKQIFLAPPPNGAGCQGCHRAPEFDIDPNTLNNGVVGIAGSTGIDLTNTRAPSLRDLFNPDGTLNGPLMHNGIFTNIDQVINHYNLIPINPQNTNLDPRLQGPGGNLQLTPNERASLIAFLKTLTGTSVYTDEKWSNPFDEQGHIDIVEIITGINSDEQRLDLRLFPNPTSQFFSANLGVSNFEIFVFDAFGRLSLNIESDSVQHVDVSILDAGSYFVVIRDKMKNLTFKAALLKQ